MATQAPELTHAVVIHAKRLFVADAAIPTNHPGAWFSWRDQPLDLHVVAFCCSLWSFIEYWIFFAGCWMLIRYAVFLFAAAGGAVNGQTDPAGISHCPPTITAA